MTTARMATRPTVAERASIAAVAVLAVLAGATACSGNGPASSGEAPLDLGSGSSSTTIAPPTAP